MQSDEDDLEAVHRYKKGVAELQASIRKSRKNDKDKEGE